MPMVFLSPTFSLIDFKQEVVNLRKEVVAIEEERQLKIQEFLLNYLPRQRRAFSSFSELQKSLTNDLIVRESDSSMEETMRDKIDHHIAKLSNTASEPPKPSPEPLSVRASMTGFKAMLVERKIGCDSWHKTLAIATDSYLHMFHVPGNAKSLTSAMDAFEELASPLISSSLDESGDNNSDSSGSSLFSSGNAFAPLTPFQSFHLPNCKLNLMEGGTEIMIDNEDLFTRGMVMLRPPSKHETSKLLNFLKASSKGRGSQFDSSTEVLACVAIV